MPSGFRSLWCGGGVPGEKCVDGSRQEFLGRFTVYASQPVAGSTTLYKFLLVLMFSLMISGAELVVLSRPWKWSLLARNCFCLVEEGSLQERR